MSFHSSLLTFHQLWLGTVIFSVFFIVAVVAMPWRLWLQNNTWQQVTFASSVALLVLWLIHKTIVPGLSFHFLGMVAYTLVVGWPLALIGAALVQFLLTTVGITDVASVGVNSLMVGIPVLITQLMLQWVEARKPKNVFVFIFIVSFIPALLSTLIVLTLALLLMTWAGSQLPFGVSWELLAFAPLVMLPEAFINGMIISGLVVYYPEWVITFNEKRYYHK
ncbi:energy-coupling factor ABC transporter permease [Zooshikella marina]|uniref:energy-coupling factor ABC transporter permease n=1 Tax=Zooshikella ganghwensis TaxID=202772 RepID=UPI001BAE76A1|nr:energy-coupling factor ABC transporter permease [Zooshikella ganghwensis]MBU2707272.1 energy-coupling factor ABC transporter permease [Zooshikella ganghwensis]